MAEMEGKVVLVAGAGAVDPDGIGNGRAAAILMAEAGARIMCVDRDLALARRTVEMITERGGEAAGLRRRHHPRQGLRRHGGCDP